MGSCYSDDHIARDHIHANIMTCNVKEPQQKYRLGTVGNWGRGGLKVFNGYKPSLFLQWFETFGPHNGFLIHR